MARRRTQWIDAIQSSFVVLAGAVAPGTVIETSLLTEAEIENLGGGLTLLKVIGDIVAVRTAGTPVLTFTLYFRQQYAGAVGVPDWDNDAFQRKAMVGTWMTTVQVQDATARLPIDLRSKRKIGQGVSLVLAAQNHSAAANDANYAFHLRALVALP